MLQISYGFCTKLHDQHGCVGKRTSLKESNRCHMPKFTMQWIWMKFAEARTRRFFRFHTHLCVFQISCQSARSLFLCVISISLRTYCFQCALFECLLIASDSLSASHIECQRCVSPYKLWRSYRFLKAPSMGNDP